MLAILKSMKKIYLSLFAAMLFVSVSLSAQPWWVENVLFIQVSSGPNGANGSNECIVHWQPGASTTYDPQYDAQALPGGLNNPFVYTWKNYTDHQTLGVNGYPSLTQDYTIPLGFRAGYTGSHTFTFEDSASFVMPKVVYLEDMLLNTWTNVITTPTYTFTAAIGDSANNRFVLHAYGQVNIAVNNAACNGTGSIQIGPGGSTQWQTYALVTSPGNVPVTNGNYVLPTTISNVASGNYTLKLTNAHGLVYSYPVTIAPSGPPVSASFVSLSDATCVGNDGTATISATGGTGNITITWNTSPPQTGATATGLAPGTYIATATANGGCADTVQVTIGAPSPITVDLTAASNAVFVDSVLAFSANFSGADSLIWNFGDGSPVVLTDATGLNHSFDAPGSYDVVVTTTGPCPESDTVTVVVSIFIGLNETEEAKAKVIMSEGKLTVRYNSQSKLDMAIYNTAGQLVESFNKVAGTNGQYIVNVKNSLAGIYYVKVSDGKHQFARKLGVWN